MNENNVVEGTYVPEFAEESGNTDIVAVNNGDYCDNYTTGEAVLGTAIVGGVSIAIWEGGKWLFKKFIRPGMIKIGRKFEKDLAAEEAEKKKNAGNGNNAGGAENAQNKNNNQN